MAGPAPTVPRPPVANNSQDIDTANTTTNTMGKQTDIWFRVIDFEEHVTLFKSLPQDSFFAVKAKHSHGQHR